MNPFTDPAPKGQPPYWLRGSDDLAAARHLKLLTKLAAIHALNPPAKHLPNPGARSWHDL